MDVFIFWLCAIGLFFSIDSSYYYYHKGLKNNVSIIVVLFILDAYDRICNIIKEIKRQYAK